MIYCLSGKLLKKSLDQVVISCAGVGYQVQTPSSVSAALPAVGSEATLYTYMNVTDSDVSLFGFESEEQQNCFKLLTSVSGVGPKVGIAILNVMSPEKVALSISAGDHKAFTAASGVGPKLGQRIVLELKDKVRKSMTEGLSGMDAAPVPAGSLSQAIAALASLGYTASEAGAALAKLDESLPVEELIRLALRSMARR